MWQSDLGDFRDPVVSGDSLMKILAPVKCVGDQVLFAARRLTD